MNKNIGSIDQIIRYALAAIIIILFVINVITGLLGYIMLAVAAIFIVTALFNFCPIWWILGIKTNTAKK